MDRKEFIKTCGYSCFALLGVSAFFPGCTAGKSIQATVKSNTISVRKNEFIKGEQSAGKFVNHLVVHADNLPYPIVLFRKADSGYRAIQLRCSHQNQELNVNGNVLSCSAHGSEFNSEGAVIQGPAQEHLTVYKVTSEPDLIFIHLT